MLDWKAYIESNPNVLCGKPVINNSRIPVDLIFEKLAEGDTIDDLLEAYQNLTSEHIKACFAFASETVKNKVILSKA